MNRQPIKMLFTSAVMIAITSSAMAQEVQQTRFGPLAISEDDNLLLFKEKPVTSSINDPEGDGIYVRLSFIKKFEVGDSDVVLLEGSIGGKACPMKYHFVSVSAQGIKVSKPFGSCSDELTEVTQNNTRLTVTMPDYADCDASSDRKHLAECEKAAQRKRVYVYEQGMLTENGKPVK